MLFTETFYDDNMKKYKIISISKPLIAGSESYQEERQDILRTQADSREFLIKNVPGGKAILRKTEEVAEEFNFHHSSGNYLTLLRQKILPRIYCCWQFDISLGDPSAPGPGFSFSNVCLILLQHMRAWLNGLS